LDFIPKEQVANYLETYATHFNFTIHHQIHAQKIEKKENTFIVTTNQQAYTADNIILAT
jgi:putative flavoprotein involved in K+ transport